MNIILNLILTLKKRRKMMNKLGLNAATLTLLSTGWVSLMISGFR